MKRFILSKKGIALLAALVVAAVAAIGAYAYFTTTGSGTGTVAAGSNTQTITLHATWPTGIVPGDGGQSVSFTGDNPNTTTSLRVGTISFVSVSSTDAGCQSVIDNGAASQFSMADVASNTTIPAGQSGYALNGTGTLVWADSATQDQTPCAGKALTLHVSSN